jgi:hypothetical protein
MKRILSALGLNRWQAVPPGLLVLVSLGALGWLCYGFWRWDRAADRDIYYLWQDGNSLLHGTNPYARILTGNMRENQKYPTYFPLFYLLSAGTQGLGLRAFPQWLLSWRLVLLACHLGIAAAVSFPLYRRGLTALAVFAGLFCLFNRWNLWLLQDGQIDFLAILPLVTSLLLVRKAPWTALVLFSLSLAVKQVAIFLVPLYLIWTWQAGGNKPGKRLLLAGAVIGSIPLATSLPLLLWNAEALGRSLWFSVSRDAADSFGVFSMNTLLHLDGAAGKLPMGLLMGLVFWAALRWRLGRFTSALLVLASFVDFNAVLFRQYLCWLVPLLPLTVWETAGGTVPETPCRLPTHEGVPEAAGPFGRPHAKAG